MATANTIISASQYNALRTRVLHVLATGAGDYGYGQNASLDTASGAVRAVQMNNLKELIQRARRHQVGNHTGFTEAQLPTISANTTTTAAQMTLYENAVGVIEADRLVAPNASLTTTGVRHTVRRNAMWGSPTRPVAGPRGSVNWVSTGYPSDIYTDVNVTWSNENRARWYFNSGGGLRVSVAHPNRSNQPNINWANSVARMGTITLRAYSTAGAPSRGFVRNVGFFHLTSSFEIIYDGTDIDTNYNYIPNYQYVDDMYVYARKIANGVQLRVRLYERNRTDYIAAGTTASFSNVYATTHLKSPAILLPNYVTASNF